MTEALKRAQAKYDMEKCVRVSVKFNKATEADLIRYIDLGSSQGIAQARTVKELMRLGIQKLKEEEQRD